MNGLARAVFLDKDGTLVDDVPYNADPARIVLAGGAGEGLRRFSRMGYRLLVVSNQPGVALGRFPESALGAVRDRLCELLREEGVQLAGFYYCPHHPQGSVPGYALACTCRKPHPGLLRRAAARHGIDLDGSWMVGDILDDVEAGRRAGTRTILIDSGNETEWRLSPLRMPDLVVPNLHAAAMLAEAALDIPGAWR